MPAEPTYTYSYNPATDTKDAVRSLIGDTNLDSGGWLLSDQEILWQITNEGSQYLAAAACCEQIATHYTGPKRNVASRRIGDLMVASGKTSKGGAEDWYAVAKTLRRRASRGAMPAAGGIDVLDRQDRTDDNLLQPEFVRGMDNYNPAGIDDFDGTGRRL